MTLVHFHSGPWHGTVVDVGDELMAAGMFRVEPGRADAVRESEFENPEHPLLRIPYEYRISSIQWPNLDNELGDPIKRYVAHNRHLQLVIVHFTEAVSDDVAVETAISNLNALWHSYLLLLEVQELTMFEGFGMDQSVVQHTPTRLVQYSRAQIVLAPVDVLHNHNVESSFTIQGEES